MNAGTLSLAMMTPLTKPTAAAPATPAIRPTTTEGNSGAPLLNAQRRASAERTEPRLITHPTDRSMPALMMTKVWPNPSSSTGMIATRMFWELRMVRKLTSPPLTSGTATTKNSTIRPRKSHAQMRLSSRASRCVGVSLAEGAASAGSAILDPRSVTRRCPRDWRLDRSEWEARIDRGRPMQQPPTPSHAGRFTWPAPCR